MSPFLPGQVLDVYRSSLKAADFLLRVYLEHSIAPGFRRVVQREMYCRLKMEMGNPFDRFWTDAP